MGCFVAFDENGFAGFQLLARQIWKIYTGKIPVERDEATHLSPLEDIDRKVIAHLLDPKEGLPPEARAILRTRKGLPAEAAEPPPPSPSTNAPPEKAK
jgi:hypothetical protein